MKRYNNLYENLIDLNKIIVIYKNEIRKNTKNKRKLERFENFFMLNVVNILKMLESKKLVFDQYSIFLINEPKYRIITSQTIKDKLVNHLIAREVLLKVYNNTLLV